MTAPARTRGPIPDGWDCSFCQKGDREVRAALAAVYPDETVVICVECARLAAIEVLGGILPDAGNGPTLAEMSDVPGPANGWGTPSPSPRLQAVLDRLPSKRRRPGLLVRVRSALANNNITTLEQLIAARAEMSRWKNFGPTSRVALELAIDEDARAR